MRTRLAWLAPLVLFAAVATAGEMYRYTDKHGRTHFTDSYYEVPEQYRDQIEDIGADYAEGGRLSVLPGFGEQPGAKAAADKKKGKKDAKAGGAAGFKEGFEKGFTSVTGVAPGAVSPGLLIFAALLAFFVMLAIGGGILKTACNIANERPLALSHAMLVVVIQGLASGLASFALNLTLSIVGQPSPTLALVGAVAGFTTSTVVNAAVLKGLHCETWVGAFKVTFTVMLLGILMIAPVLYCAAR
jgi:hypothetical protein